MHFPRNKQKIFYAFIVLIFVISLINIIKPRKRIEYTPRELSEEEDEEWELDNENVPDLSIILGTRKNGPKYHNPKCAKFPDLFTVQYNNIHWQVQETWKEIYYFYSAFLDLRGREGMGQENILNGGSVRVLAMSDARMMALGNMTLKVCQFWFPNRRRPMFGKVTDCRMLWKVQWGSSGLYYPYLITCQLPPLMTQVPSSVSLVENICDNATNNLNILHKQIITSPETSLVPKKEFGVCVKALDFPDGDKVQYRLAEWIEMLRILGADKIFFYEYYVDSDIKKVLNYYENQGIIDVQQTTLPGDLPNQPQLRHFYIRGKRLNKRLTELIPYNDCLYRHMYEYEYVLVIDTDELIMPVENIKWSEVFELVNKEDLKLSSEGISINPFTTYCFRNFYFLDGMLSGKDETVAHIPPEFHMLRHVYRSTNSTGTKYMKCFHSTSRTLGVHNHLAFFCRDMEKCKTHVVNLKRAQMNHYRSTCVTAIKNCSLYSSETVKDTKIWRYENELVSRVQKVIHATKPSV